MNFIIRWIEATYFFLLLIFMYQTWSNSLTLKLDLHQLLDIAQKGCQ